jgi:hypothetical protein
VLHDSNEDFEALVRKTSRPLEQHVNFLGQTALHLAVQQPSRVAYLLNAGHEIDPLDNRGNTPLVYAAVMNIPDTTIQLKEHGARFIISVDDGPISLVETLLRRGGWDLFWKTIDLAEATQLTRLLLRCAVHYYADGACYLAHERDDVRNGCLNFWSKVISILGSPNILFDSGDADACCHES